MTYKGITYLGTIAALVSLIGFYGTAMGQENRSRNTKSVTIELSLSQPDVANCYTSSIFLQEQRNESLLLYPNPTNGWLKIEVSNVKPLEDINVQIFNLDGRLLRQTKTQYRDNDGVNDGKVSLEFNLEDLPKGVYFVHSRIEKTTNIQKLIIY
jgi:hypothetical protein